MSLFENLSSRNGQYNLPFLIKLSSCDFKNSLYFVNDIQDIIYKGQTFKAATFRYAPNPDELGFSGGGTLEISVINNNITDFIEYNRFVHLKVIGILLKQGLVKEIKTYRHKYGSVKGSRSKVTFTFEKDDRLSMTFPALIWNNSNNRGNS